jgi:hypothetical protein
LGGVLLWHGSSSSSWICSHKLSPPSRLGAAAAHGAPCEDEQRHDQGHIAGPTSIMPPNATAAIAIAAWRRR